MHQLAVTKFSMGSEVAFTFHWKGANRPDLWRHDREVSKTKDSNARITETKQKVKTKARSTIRERVSRAKSTNQPDLRTRSTYEGTASSHHAVHAHLTEV